jgi:O-antigen/teichoic acid export membrane protein
MAAEDTTRECVDIAITSEGQQTKRTLLPRSQFARNVITLMTGTTVAQAIPIAISPILTRVYSPDDLGIFALYMSIVSIASVVSTGRYEMAIMMPTADEEDEVRAVVFVTTVIMVTVAFAILIAALLFRNTVASLLGQPKIADWLLFVPISVLAAGLYQILTYLLIRRAQFRTLSVNKVCFSAISGPSQVCLGALHLGAVGMLVANISSYFITCCMILKSARIRSFFKLTSKPEALKIANKYKQYPKYDIPAMLLNLVANQLPLLAMGKYLSLTTLGLYSLMNRTLMAPIGLVSNSILDAFKQRATDDYQRCGNFRDIYVKVLTKLCLIGIVPFFILGLTAPTLFAFIFGAQWREAGTMAQVMTPALFLNFLVNPLSYSFYVVQKQRINLIFNVLFVALMAISVFFGVLSKSTHVFVICISVTQCINYLLYLYVSFKLSGGTR